MSISSKPRRFANGGFLAALLALSCALLAGNRPADAQEAVDVQLVLAVDVSLSMSAGELEIQRRGYAEAMTHEDVIKAILSGLHGKIAVTYFEWAGNYSQRVVVPWTRIASAEDALDFAARLSSNPPGSARRTSISGALDYAGDLLAESGFRSLRRVVDISGDGPNNQGGPVVPARDRLVALGITINGLPLMTNGGLTTRFDVEDLDTYYRECVIGGPGAFVVPVNEWAQFPEAIRRKLVLELAGAPGARPPVIRARYHDLYDCLIGEKMWQDRSWMWTDP